MHRLSLFGLALLLSGCVASLAEVRQAPPDQVGNFSAPAPALSYCVLRGIEAIESSYEAHLSGGVPISRSFFSPSHDNRFWRNGSSGLSYILLR